MVLLKARFSTWSRNALESIGAANELRGASTSARLESVENFIVMEMCGNEGSASVNMNEAVKRLISCLPTSKR